MEAKKSHNLLSVSWRPRKSGGIVKFNGQKDQKEPRVKNPSPRAEGDVPAYIMRENSPSTYWFSSLPEKTG